MKKMKNLLLILAFTIQQFLLKHKTTTLLKPMLPAKPVRIELQLNSKNWMVYSKSNFPVTEPSP
jgi:hypothetical protein